MDEHSAAPTVVGGPVVDEELVEFAVAVARDAGRTASAAFFGTTPGRRRKADGTELTDVDLAVEEQVRAAIGRFAPDDAVLGEEAGESGGGSGRRWVVDPISGTGYLTRRMPLFANLLAYEDEHGPAIGVIHMPVQRETVFAARGRGCRLLTGLDQPVAAARRTRVGDRSQLDGALVLGANQHAWSEDLLTALHRRVNLVGGIHHAVVHVVTGRVDAAVLVGQGYDDLAPLPVILAEAGGRVSDLDGAPVLGGNGTVVAANPRLHGQLRALADRRPATRGGKALR
ncbi:inositol monophosphatase family protein [Micromonospora endolithica]|uniref:Inositol monophosphatase n=1 Tax=Micromonospora endolithica TaxID=230091 RepID=A0A3A9ZKG5_9ACTN|nr:inositol monophosphatase family protein [Micromonospora endolithica]RKN47867.1 inositol monophosphatase [Micromonospora endolithica]TWJ21565.1 histidinol-phosphatase [Micromonospora endolithica]